MTINAVATEGKTTDEHLGATEAEQSRARGDMLVKLKTINETPIRAEWNLDESIKNFLVRSKLVKVLKLIAEVDTIQIILSKMEDKWPSPKEIPTGEEPTHSV
eukprot:15343109-Ditylum_brightwellii.AAC.4